MIHTSLDHWHHRQRVIARKRQIELQRLDNLIADAPQILPKYRPVQLKKTPLLIHILKQLIV